jgi:cytoskeletal protein CcmA (bactofilin family)
MFSKSEGRDASFSVSGNGGGVPSIISADLKITGELISEGDIQLNGTLVGDVRSGSLTIGETAHVEGKISARELRVSGEVVGEVNAGEVALTKSNRAPTWKDIFGARMLPSSRPWPRPRRKPPVR